MKIAVLSGKGGTGKTFVSVNLAVVSKTATYIDCDVEEPNGRLFLRPQEVRTETVNTRLPQFDEKKCTACRKCVDVCRFHALAFIKNKPIVFPDVCHACGGCSLICPVEAVTEKKRPIGVVEYGTHEQVRVVTGILNLGEASGVPVIKLALEQSDSPDTLTVIDCPPGSACSVMESVQSADYCILVTEPTAFGLHNFQMVYELVSLLHKPCGVVINKAEQAYAPIDEFFDQHSLNVLCRIPYSENLSRIGARAEIACEQDEELAQVFRTLLETVQTEVTR